MRREVIMNKMIRKTATVVALLAALLCIASLSSAASAQCDHYVEVLSVCCDSTTPPPYATAGWFYNGTSWSYYSGADARTVLFQLRIDGDEYNAFCINFTGPIDVGDTFCLLYTSDAADE